MKNQNLHLLGALCVSCLVFLSGYLTYKGLSDDFGTPENGASYDFVSQSLNQDCASLLDTLRFFEEPCYEFTHYEKSMAHNGHNSASLSKTIIKVADDGEPFEAVEPNMVKKLAANASLNIMLETYTVSRSGDTSEQYLVTVESFTTKLEKLQREVSYLKPSASLSPIDIQELREYLKNVGAERSSFVKLANGKHIYQ